MALNTSTIPRTFEHLSIPDPSWLQIAAKQQVIDKLADVLYSLPLDEFRKVAYKPPPLPADAPVIGGDIDVEHTKITTRDGTRIGLRIYRPIDHGSNHLLLFNIHGGGWTVGNCETEEAQNRMISAKNKAVVVSVDYRKAPEYTFPYALHDAYDDLWRCRQA